MPVSHIRPGVVVFARVSGFPWWPAVINKCPHNEQWQEDGKFWVVFFNESTGAWLKPTELRIFDDYNIDSCLEYNGTANKYRRYKEKIQLALVLAKEYVDNSKKTYKKVSSLQRRQEGKEEALDAVSVSEAEKEGTLEGSVIEVETGRVERGRKRIQSGKSHVQRALRGNALQSEHDIVSEEENDKRSKDGAHSRPKRKRMRSIRYEEFIGSLDERNGGKRGQDVRAEQEGNPMIGERKVKGGTVALIPYDPVNGTAVLGAKHRRANAVEVNRVEDGEMERGGASTSRATRRTTRGSAHRVQNRSVGQNADVNKLANRRGPAKKSLSKRLAREPVGRVQSGQNSRPDPAETRELYISELNNLIHPAASQNHAERGRNTYATRGSLVVGSSELGSSLGGEGTDSDDRPERLRRVVNGSLEAAAADLIEHAVKGGQGEEDESASGREDILDMGCLSLGGSELVTSILNRIRDLERDVALLQQKSVGERQETLGEDASAAGLKSAVEALAAAASAFAKARDYDSGMIGRSIDLLWPVDARFPLAGADGELLRTMSTSLVLGFCKRRKKEFREQKSKTPQRQRGKDNPGKSTTDHRLKVRDLASKPHVRCKNVSMEPSRDGLVDRSLVPGESESSSSEDGEVIVIKPKSKQHPLKGRKRTRSEIEDRADNIVEEELESEVIDVEDSEEIVDGEGENDEEEVEVARSRVP